MQQDYKGYLVKFGSMALPNAFLTRYVSTPDQRTEKKAWRDNNNDLQRVTSPNFKTTLKLYMLYFFSLCKYCLRQYINSHIL